MLTSIELSEKEQEPSSFCEEHIVHEERVIVEAIFSNTILVWS